MHDPTGRGQNGLWRRDRCAVRLGRKLGGMRRDCPALGASEQLDRERLADRMFSKDSLQLV